MSEKVNVVNKNNEKVGDIELNEIIYSYPVKEALIKEYVLLTLANKRLGLASTKNRKIVSGGGIKPWKQKGTGRSRHGSIRSPLWIGGGVTHGPLKSKVYAKKINKKMKEAALFSVLSQKLSQDALLVIDSLPAVTAKTAKTKSVLPVIRPIVKNTSALIVASKAHKAIHNALRNVPRISCIAPTSLNIFDVMKAKTVVFEKDSISELVAHYTKKNS